MRCMYCGSRDSKVVDSRSTDDGTAIRRRRECLNCGKRFTTYEKVESVPIIVVKKDKSRQSFDRDKLERGILSACASRPVPMQTVDAMVSEIESKDIETFQEELKKLTEKRG